MIVVRSAFLWVPLMQILLGVASPLRAEPILTFTASHQQPCVGQLVELTIHVQLTDPRDEIPVLKADAGGFESTLPRLDAPWLDQEFGFRWRSSFRDWVRQRAYTSSPGFPLYLSKDALSNDVNLLLHPIVVFVSPDPATAEKSARSFRLRRELVVTESALRSPLEGTITLAGPLLVWRGKEVEAPALKLTVRKPPTLLSGNAGFNLGVGAYQCTVTVDDRSLRLGDETRLTLHIRGTGPLEEVARPPIGEPLLSAGLRSFPDGETSTNSGRAFHYRIAPRETGTLTLPALEYHFVDPARRVDEPYVLAATAPISIEVRSVPHESPTPNYTAQMSTLAPLSPDSLTPPASRLLAWLLVPPMAIGSLILLRTVGWFPRAWLLTPSARRALAAVSAGHDGVTVLCQYLDQRLGHLAGHRLSGRASTGASNRRFVSLTAVEIAELLRTNEGDPELCGRVRQWVESAERFRYALSAEPPSRTELVQLLMILDEVLS
jgi:hypothetical protein